WSGSLRLRQNLLDHPRWVDPDQRLIAAFIFKRQLLEIEPQQVQDGGVNIAVSEFLAHRGIAQLVGIAEIEARLQAASGHPDTEPVRIVVAPRPGGNSFDGRQSAKLARPNDQ